ncbi:MAG TPA: M14 family metallocarboxypeptidase [Verrucomicrobiae bacterium]|nr:M14 family metallocarboxypeptidase [Verrucomicrobiae bacterium]
MHRLGKNHGGYFGETIDVATVLRDVEAAALRHGWESETLPAGEGVRLQTLRRIRGGSRRAYVSAGIHGDEPAGVLAVRQLLQDDAWPALVDLWLCPCLNPTGFPLNRRENAQGIDLNRQYLHPEAAETRAHIEWLRRQPSFDVTLCLHEDWEADGFYLYEVKTGDGPSQAEAVIRRVAQVCPIDLSENIEDRPATGGIIRPSADPRSRPEWPEAFWLLTQKTRHSYTLEAPSDYPMPVRVAALGTAVRTILEGL